MEKGFITPEQKRKENTGTLLTDIEEVSPEPNTEEVNTRLLEQINHKLDLLLSIEGE